jgi:hypothetical protein
VRQLSHVDCEHSRLAILSPAPFYVYILNFISAHPIHFHHWFPRQATDPNIILIYYDVFSPTGSSLLFSPSYICVAIGQVLTITHCLRFALTITARTSVAFIVSSHPDAACYLLLKDRLLTSVSRYSRTDMETPWKASSQASTFLA